VTPRRAVRELLRTSSVSLAEGLRVGLEAEGIPAWVTNANLAGLPPAAITVSVVDDADYERGLLVLRQLQRPALTLHPAPTPHRLRRLVIILIVGVVLVLCAQLF
jgi:hypothetical protein